MKAILSLLIPALSLFLLLPASPPTPWQDKVEPALMTALQRDGYASFLVLFEQQADVSAARQQGSKVQMGTYVFERTRTVAAAAQKSAIGLLRAEQAPYRSFHIVNAIQAKGDLALVEALAGLPEVRAIQPNPTVAVDLLPEAREQQAIDFREGVEWGLAAIGADQVWNMGFTGQGVVVGGQDTGYEWDHPALKESYRGWDDTLSQADHNYNWHDAIHEIDSMNGPPYIAEANPCGLSSLVPCDDHNHGTHTMGTMTGTVSDEGKSIGVAPGAKWIACRNMERGYGSPASYIECFEWFLAPTDLNGENPDPSKAPHVIANSWSCPEIEGCTPANFETMQIAVDHLKAAGVVVVVSAGNSGSQCHTVSTPAAIFENSFTVGATRQTDTIANFSSRGTVTVDSSNRLKPNIAAPGVGVRSSIRNGGFATFSGTSMAGPHVAGAVALLISANPELAGQVEAIEELLESTARPMRSDQDCGGVSGMEVPNAVYGYGRMDILAAVQETVSTSSQATIPTAQALHAAPNPARETVLLTSVMPPAAPATVQWFDAQGRLIKTVNWPAMTTQLEVDIRDLPKGVYIVQARMGRALFSTRVVRQ
ncbi:MAG: S8 family peptidase [bacterium]|nr:S8 family peptidase [bacterium]